MVFFRARQATDQVDLVQLEPFQLSLDRMPELVSRLRSVKLPVRGSLGGNAVSRGWRPVPVTRMPVTCRSVMAAFSDPLSLKLRMFLDEAQRRLRLDHGPLAGDRLGEPP